MKHRRTIWVVLAVVVVALLLYLQFHSFGRISQEITKRNGGRPWHWSSDFFGVIADCSPLRLIIAAAFIYVGYIARGWRWKIFLSRIRDVDMKAVTAPQFVGFTAMQLLGRPGEFVRPYLIARRTGIPFSTQMAVLVVERIFDMGAFALIVAVNIAFAPALRTIPHHAAFQKGSYMLLAIVAGLACFAYLLYRAGDVSADFVARMFSGRFGASAADKMRSFSRGLHILSGTTEVLTAGAVSLLTWMLIAGCYLFTVHAFAAPEVNTLNLQQVLLLMFFSVAGGVVQLPGIGGGSQVATILALQLVFSVPLGTAAAAGILLWLMSNMAVVPVGLALMRSEHISLTAISHESHDEEKAEAPAS